MQKPILIVSIVVGLGIVTGLIVGLLQRLDTETSTPNANTATTNSVTVPIENVNQAESVDSNNAGSAKVRWSQSANGYQPSGTPPACPDPFVITTPVDLSKVYSILYPGQVRGAGGFRGHGGFRFDGFAGDEITVTIPMDADIIEVARYLESGNEQIFLTFIHECGMMYRFDHMVTVTPEIQAVVDALPPAQPDDSRTTLVNPPIPVREGDVLATAVGSGSNVFVDFGVYDLRQENAASADPAWRAAHPSVYERNGICWFDLLNDADAAIVRAKRAGGSDAGAESDYCT